MVSELGMSNTAPINLGQRVTAALHYIESGLEIDTRAHYLWTLKNVMRNLELEHLSTQTLVSLLAVLIPEHSRVLATREIRQQPSGLRIVR